MKTLHLLISQILLGAVIIGAQVSTEPADPPIDSNKARVLLGKQRDGETLTPDELRYLERARALRRNRRPNAGSQEQRPAPARLIPLTDMGADDRYEGEDGGLYGGGKNALPGGLQERARAELEKIRPLDGKGEPTEDGRIGFVSVSMSNATQEFSRFKGLADRSPEKSESVAIVDCAQGGQAMAEWAPADARPWKVANQRLAAAGVSPQQVQVAWIKLANKSPRGSLTDHGRELERDTLHVLGNAKQKFPNLRIAYLSSRIWAGNATGSLNPEPYAYESAFPIRWLIARQIKGDPELGLINTPLLLWGPYLWAEGEKGRKTDDLLWQRSDFAGDGVHPSDSGRQKVAALLLEFFTTSPLARSWFVASP